MTPPTFAELDRAARASDDPAVWLQAMAAYELEQSRRRTSAEVRAAFLRAQIAGCGLPFSDAPAVP